MDPAINNIIGSAGLFRLLEMSKGNTIRDPNELQLHHNLVCSSNAFNSQWTPFLFD